MLAVQEAVALIRASFIYWLLFISFIKRSLRGYNVQRAMVYKHEGMKNAFCAPLEWDIA